jgi:hypothetical protein
MITSSKFSSVPSTDRSQKSCLSEFIAIVYLNNQNVFFSLACINLKYCGEALVYSFVLALVSSVVRWNIMDMHLGWCYPGGL